MLASSARQLMQNGASLSAYEAILWLPTNLSTAARPPTGDAREAYLTASGVQVRLEELELSDVRDAL